MTHSLNAITRRSGVLLVTVAVTLLLPQGCLQVGTAAAVAAAAAAATTFPLPSDHKACHNDEMNTAPRICDIDGILGLKAIQQLEVVIADLESMNNVTCHDVVLGVEMGIYIVDSVSFIVFRLCLTLGRLVFAL
jgi:hypothetical protein